MNRHPSCCRSIIASSAIVLWLGCFVGCSEDSGGGPQGSGGKGSGGRTATGGTVGSGGCGNCAGSGGSGATGGTIGSGGSSKGSGGSSPGSGGSAKGSGGRTTAVGGSTAGAGGATTAVGGSTAGNGGATTGTGGSMLDGGQSLDSATADGSAGGRGGSAGSTSGTGGTAGSTGTGTKSAGCGKTITRQDAKTQKTLSVGGKTRYYLLYTPTTYDPETPLPMVFILHGMNMNNWWAANDSSGFKMIEASSNKAILVYPQGSGDAPGTTSKWGNINSNWSDTGNDLQFIDDLVKSMEESYCVDTKRIFVTGFSMGGMMTESLACMRSKVFRAFAPVAGWGPGGMGGMNSPSCSDSSVMVPVMITQGSSDTTVRPEMGQASRDFWIKRNSCQSTTTNITVPSGGATCVAYQGCKEGTAVDYCTHSGDHMVPGNTGAYVWAFFSSFN